MMAQRVYKRLRMEIEFRHASLNPPQLPAGYVWLPWRSLLLERHANVKWRSFREDLDGKVFACLGDAPGCLALMREIASQRTFCPSATWMVAYQPEPNWPPSDCGTIQGITRTGGIGAIQNVGVTPEHRRLGLGRALVIQSLLGFMRCGMAVGTLEVTAENESAVNLYKSLGFRIVEVLYRDSTTGETTQSDDETPVH
jgi:ribosomal protein S18 acetylase RimI-like enzyme